MEIVFNSVVTNVSRAGAHVFHMADQRRRHEDTILRSRQEFAEGPLTICYTIRRSLHGVQNPEPLSQRDAAGRMSRRTPERCMLWYEGQQAPFTPTPQDASYLMRLLSRKGGLFVLKGACMGSCPAKTTDGDFVCKPLRAKYLCLSRGCLAGGHHTFVGECHLDGFMDGEMWDRVPEAGAGAISLRWSSHSPQYRCYTDAVFLVDERDEWWKRYICRVPLGSSSFPMGP